MLLYPPGVQVIDSRCFEQVRKDFYLIFESCWPQKPWFCSFERSSFWGWMYRVVFCSLNKVGKTTHLCLCKTYALNGLVVLVSSVLPGSFYVTSAHQISNGKGWQDVWIQKHQRVLHFLVENLFQFHSQSLSLSTNMSSAVSNVRVHGLRRFPAKPSLHFWQCCCWIF